MQIRITTETIDAIQSEISHSVTSLQVIRTNPRDRHYFRAQCYSRFATKYAQVQIVIYMFHLIE